MSSLRSALRLVSPALVLACAGATSCTSAPPPIDTPTAQVTATASASASAAPATYDRSPVEAPKNVAVMLHAKSLASTLSKLGADPDGLVTRLLGAAVGKGALNLDVPADKLASQIAIEAPVDAMVKLPDGKGFEPMVAVAIGLKSLEDAKTAFNATNMIEPGMWLFGGDKSRGTCVVADANGLVPARIICSMDEHGIEALGPYLARGASSIPSTADIALDIDFGVINDKFGPELANKAGIVPSLLKSRLGLGGKGFDKLIDTAGIALGNEGIALLADLDKVHVAVDVSSGQEISLTGQASFKGAKSWTARTGAKSQNEPAPGVFSRLPADVADASYSHLNDPADWDSIKETLKTGLEDFLAGAKIGSDADRKKVTALLDFPLTKDMAFVSASGGKHVSKANPRKTDQDKINAMFDAQLGFRLYGFGEKAEGITAWLKNAVAAYNAPGIQKELSKSPTLPLFKTPAAPKSLGKDAYELDAEFKLGTDKGAPNFTLYVMVMPDGDESWIAVGANKEELIARLEMVKTGAPADKTLAQRKDFDVTAKHAMGGFWTLESFKSLGFGLAANADKGANVYDVVLQASDNLDKLLASLPSQGATPIQYSFSITSASPLVSSFALTIPKATIVDAKAILDAVRK